MGTENPFDRTLMNRRERPLSSDINWLESMFYSTIAELMLRQYAPRTSRLNDKSKLAVDVGSAGFISDAFKVRPATPASMVLTINAGLGFHNSGVAQQDMFGGVNTDDTNALKPLSLTVDELINVPAADPGNPRIDIVEVSAAYAESMQLSRDVLSPPPAPVFAPTPVFKVVSPNLNGKSGVVGPLAPSVTPIGYKTGQPGGAPVAPAVTAGYVKIAEVRVDAAAANIAQNKITDRRRMIFQDGVGRVWVGIGPAYGNRLVAPAGVEIGTVSGPGSTPVDLYIKAGDLSAIGEMVATGSEVQDFVTPQLQALQLGLPAVVTVDAALQTALHIGSQPLEVAVGQQLIHLNITADSVFFVAPNNGGIDNTNIPPDAMLSVAWEA